MGFLSWLSGGGKAVEDTTETIKTATKEIASGIDVLWFTDEEKSQASMEWMKVAMSMLKATGDGGTIRAVTRRLLAFAFTVNFLILVDVAVFFACMGQKDVVTSLIEIADAFWIGFIQLTIVTFFFGVHLVRGWLERKK